MWIRASNPVDPTQKARSTSSTRVERFPLFRWRKCSFQGISRLGTEGNGMKKNSFTKNPAPANRMFSSETSSERNFESLLLFLFHGRVVFSSAEWFGTEFQVFATIFVPWNGIPSCFLYRGMVQNGFPRVCFYFCSMVPSNRVTSSGFLH